MHRVSIRVARRVVALGGVACLSVISALAQNARPAQGQPTKPVLLEDLDKPAGPVTIGEPKVMPNIVGIALHMGVDEAMAALRRAYPSRRVQANTMPMPTVSKPATITMFLPQSEALNFADVVAIDLTLPPEKQAVWRVARYAMNQHANRTTVLAALREKYGKETVAFASPNDPTPTTDDRQILSMLLVVRRARAPRAGTARAERFARMPVRLTRADDTGIPALGHAGFIAGGDKRLGRIFLYRRGGLVLLRH